MTAVMMDLSSEALVQGPHIKVKDLLSMGCESHKLNDYIQSLETERRKIEGFRRELPLCMQLITDVIRAVREQQSQQVQCAASSSVLKLSCNSEEDDGSDDQSPSGVKRKLETSNDDTAYAKKRKSLDIDLEKPHWMAQAQLWHHDHENTKEVVSAAATVRPQAKHAVPGTLGLGGGAFSPFVRTTTTAEELKPNSEVLDINGTTSTAAAAASPRPSNPEQEQGQAEQGSEPQQPKSNSSSSGAGQRKSRRCWSPELHHRFVAALQQLGGAHAATPKQIREIMKVDGLTSDEVKSHLQKYRLHTRRPSMNPGAAAGGCQPTQLVVLGGIWVPPEFAHQHNPSAASSPAAGAGFVSPFTHEFYSRMSAAAAAAAAATPAPASNKNRSASPKPKMSVEPNQAMSSEGESLEGGEQEGQSRHEGRDQEED